MKYKAGDILWYVNPFVFDIEKVKIEIGILPEATDPDDVIYYMDGSGAYLDEKELFTKLEDAQAHAYTLLENFYNQKLRDIYDISETN